MGSATILWSLAAGVSITFAVLGGFVWISGRRSPVSLTLFFLGISVAACAYLELWMMHAATPAEYGALLRWYHLPIFLAFAGQVFVVHYYLGTSRLWLFYAAIVARTIVLAVNFTVLPNFTFSSIASLRPLSLLGEQVFTVQGAVPRASWQEFALFSLILLMAYLVDAAVRRWRLRDGESKRRALTVVLGIAAPWLCAIAYTQFVVFGVIHGPISNLPWFFGALCTITYEFGRDYIRGRGAMVELAELQRQLMQAERISVLGQLTSSLAHELGQPLSANAMNADTALKYLDQETPDLVQLRAALTDVRSDSLRCVELITHMQRLFKRRAIEMQPVGLQDVIQNAVSLVREEAAARRVSLSLLVPADLPRVLGDRVHLSQVLMNLLLNAIHAVQVRPPDARRVVVEARTGDGKNEIEVAVRDTGPGIPEEIVNKLFGPFFTTKPDGMGMGLALSRRIIEAHGGRVWVDRAARQGAIFRFTLQRA